MFKSTILALSSVLILSSTPALSKSHQTNSMNTSDCDCKKQMCSGHMEEHQMKMMEKLQLTPEQQAKIKQIRMKYKSDQRQDYKMLSGLRSQMMTLSSDKEMNTSKLDTLIKQRSEISANLIKNKVMMRHEIYQLLNDSQRSKLNEMKTMYINKKMKAS